MIPTHCTPKIRNHIAAATTLLAIISAPAHAADLNVAVTIKPIHALLAQVMQGVAEPYLLVSGSASPHTFAMKPSDAAALNKATVFFRTSEAVEPFTHKVIESIPSSVRVVTLADTAGMALLKQRTGATFDAHDEHDAHEAQDTGDHHNEHERHGFDGHIWLDPANARVMVSEMVRVLSEVSPENAVTFKTNAARATANLTALEAELATALAPVKAKPFVVFHDAYQYFERRFELEAVGSITVSPEVQPSAKRLTEIRKKLAALKASCVFAEPHFQPSLVAAVIEGTGAKAGTLDPEGTQVSAGPDAYAALMRALATNISACLR